MKLWTGQTISTFGSTITREAIPYIAVITLGATPVQMGLLAAAASVPVLLIGLIAGAQADRLRRRPLMIAADLLRAVLVLVVPAAAVLGILRLQELFAIAALAGAVGVFFDVAYPTYVPTLVRRDQLVEANSKLGLSSSLAEVAAPGLAGVLVQTLTGPIAMLIDAASFVWSAISVALIRAPEPAPAPPADRQHLGREIIDGLRTLMGHPVLRAFALTGATGAFFGNFFATLYGLYAYRVLHLTPALLGIAVAMGGAGELIGAPLAARVSRRFGVGRTLVATSLIGSAVSLLIPLARGPVVLAAAMLMISQLVNDGANAIYGINELSVRQAITPGRLLGRVNAGMQLLRSGIGPLGAIVAGVLAQAISPRPTVLVAVLGGALGVIWLVRSPIPGLKGLPDCAVAGQTGAGRS